MSFRRFASENQPVGTRISVHNGQTLTSSGVASLDELMGGGIPLGRILLLKQDNFSGYSTLLLKYFIAQGIALKHEISLVSLDNSPMELLSELMRVVEPSISENEEEYVPPIQRGVGRTLGSLRPNRSEKMTIAWRYEKQGQFLQMSAKNNPNYCNTFDLTKKIEKEDLDAANLHVIDKYTLGQSCYYAETKSKALNTAIERTSSPNVLRIAIDAIASPFWNQGSDPINKLYRFFHSLKINLRETNAVALVTIPAYLYTDLQNQRLHPMIRRVEHAVDAVIEIQSFAGSLVAVNPLYTLDYHGLIHPSTLFQVDSMIQTTRLPIVKLHSLGFKVRRKRFSIEPFVLPPEEDDEDGGSESKSNRNCFPKPMSCSSGPLDF